MLMTSISTDVNHKCPKKCIDDIGHSLAKAHSQKLIRLFDLIPVTVQVGGGTQCGRQQCTQGHASLKSARARADYTVAIFV